jgi:hypothetical protein
LTDFFGTGFRVAGLLRATAVRFGVAFFGAAAFFFTEFFADAAGFADLTTFLTLFLAEVGTVVLVALRAGAFPEGERLTIGLGRADFPGNARPLVEDVEEA